MAGTRTDIRKLPPLYEGHDWGEPETAKGAGWAQLTWCLELKGLPEMRVTLTRATRHEDVWEAQVRGTAQHLKSEERDKALQFLRDYIEGTAEDLLEFMGEALR